MPYALTYEFRLIYRILPFVGAQPAVPVHLSMGGRSTQTLGILDTGSVLTVFDEAVAQQLGIQDLTEGRAVVGNSLGGSVRIYQFDVEMSVTVDRRMIRFPAQVGFCPGYQSRNILGRNLVFAHFLVGIHEREQRVYLQPEE